MSYSLSTPRILRAALFCGLLAIPVLLFAQSPRLGVPFGHTTPVTSLQLSPDGMLITSGQDANIFHWDLNKRKLLRSVPSPYGMYLRPATVEGISYGDAVNVAYRKGGEYIDLNSGEVIECTITVRGKTDTIGMGYFSLNKGNVSKDGKYFLEKGRLTPGCVRGGDTLDIDFPAQGFVPGGDFLYQLSDSTLKRWAYPDYAPAERVTLEDFPDSTGALQFIGPGKFGYLSLEGEDRKTRIYHLWNLLNGKKIGVAELPTRKTISDVHPSGKFLLVHSFTGGRRRKSIEQRYNLETNELDVTYKDPYPAKAVIINDSLPGAIYSPEGDFVLYPNLRGTVYLLHPESGTAWDSLSAHAAVVERVDGSQTNDGIFMVKKAVGSFTESFAGYFWNWKDLNTLGVVTIERATAPPPGTPEGRALNATRRLEIVEIKNPSAERAKFTINDRTGERIHSTKEVDFSDPITSGRDLRVQTHAIYGNSTIAIGTRGGDILFFDKEGAFYSILSGHTESVNSLSFTEGAKRLISASDDGTMKIWDLASGELIVTLVLINDLEWVVLGPNNLFDASPRAMSLLYYVVDDGEGGEEIVELEQMKERFYSPGLLQQLLGYNKRPLRSIKGLDQVDLYPKVEKMTVGNDSLHLRLRARTGDIGKVALFLNDKELEEDINPDRATSISLDLKRYQSFMFHDNVLSVRAYNKEASLRSSPVETEYIYPEGAKARGTTNDNSPTPTLSREDYLDAKLYVLCVGTSDYTDEPGESMDLSFPDVDAEMMGRALKMVGCELFCSNAEVDVVCLNTNDSLKTDLEAENIRWDFSSKENIVREFKTLSEKARPQDIVIVYFSGHGKTYRSNDKDQFHYLTYDVRPGNVGDETATKNAVIASDELTTLLKSIPAAKQVLILDACNSGQIIDDISLGSKDLNGSQIRALTQMSDRTGLYLLTGSAGDMVSYEASKFGHGLLTYALLNGMNGQATTKDEEGISMVGITRLFDYAQGRVVDLARSINGIQKPQVNYPLRAGTFPIGIFNDNTKIPITGAKPTVVRCRVVDRESFEDELDLEVEMERLFRKEARKGPKAAYTYVDIGRLEDAYYVVGSYTVDEEGLITLSANLVQNKTKKIPLVMDVGGEPLTATSMEKLARKIEQAVRRKLKGR
ncbi:caspase family protein [Neolewinella agarilytica]|uniref:Uncharacterized protein, contains caspase domain n=1 Tax=Neolewinella agarilytica TaxID=478744 RepID=A0A1H9AB43_9BACT|nr:caspase family protein [Neolewinella agarilytica]SEP73972.1 Uncharacterized protein, contains caspase domain [Neolewinella agarilytica]